MRVSWVIPCRYVEVNANLATSVGGNIDRAGVPAGPASLPVQVLCAVRISAAHEELDRPEQSEPGHSIACRVYGPSMALISELAQPFGFAGEFDAAVEPAIVLPVGVVFQPMEVGQHTLEIAVDDRGYSVPFTIAVAGQE